MEWNERDKEIQEKQDGMEKKKEIKERTAKKLKMANVKWGRKENIEEDGRR